MKLEVTPEEMAGLNQGFLLKKIVIGKCPKKGERFVIDAKNCAIIAGEVYAKEQWSNGCPKAYRLIFGKALVP